MKPFRIFRPGKHTASCGTAVEFTEDDLKRAVAAYNPGLYAAPFVIGHPKTEDRAYGWAASLSYEDGHVVVHPDEARLEPTFAGMVQEGAFRNRSASWYMPEHPNNPSPGNLYPKHIGWLGAAPPALKGLGDVEFAAEDHPELVVEFGEADWQTSSALGSVARMFRGLRDWMLAKEGLEAADALVPSYAIDDLESTARGVREAAIAADKSTAMPAPAFSEGTTTMTPTEIAALQAQAARATELEGQVASFSQREVALQAAERQALVATIDRDLGVHVQAGRLLPASRTAVANFMADLNDADQVIEFGEAADGQPAPKVTPRAFFTSFLATLPRQVDYRETSGVTVGNSNGSMTPRVLADKATKLRDDYRAANHGREISFTEATNRVLQAEGIDVAESGLAATE